MHICVVCNYSTITKCNLDKHNLTKRHLENVLLVEKTVSMVNEELKKDIHMFKPIVCNNCHKEYKHLSSYSRHKSRCINQHQQSNILKTKVPITGYPLLETSVNDGEIQILKKEIENLKNNYNNLVEINKLKNQIIKLQINNTNNTTNTNNIINNNNTNNITNNNNIKISKVQFLNLNFGNVIDIQTFTQNYKTKYGLTNQQSLTLLENYQNDGVNGFVSALIYYLKKSAIQQYREIIGKDIEIENIILQING